MREPAATAIAYCGSPPAPDAIWGRWNFDPVLIFALLAVLGLYLAGSRRLGRLQACAFFAGWGIAAAALISPLCPLSVSLFSARVGQHMVLTLIAAPLVMLGQPGRAFAVLWPAAAARLAARKGLGLLRGAAASVILFTLALWFWHSPGPYAATFASPIVYWIMHLTVFGTALMVWNIVLDPARVRLVAAICVAAVSTLQMTLLGAIITMAREPAYAPHFLTPYAWGLTPLADQQLGGLIMWVPGGGVFLAITILALGRAMSERAAPAFSRPMET